MIIRHKHVRLIFFPFPDKPMQIRDVFDKNMEYIFLPRTCMAFVNMFERA
jgi:hypothetical protein